MRPAMRAGMTLEEKNQARVDGFIRGVVVKTGIALLYIFGIIGIWQLCVTIFEVPRYLIPPPLDVLRSMTTLPQYYLKHALVTFSEAGLGILLGFSTGFLVGLLLRYGGWVGRAFSPLVVASQVFPKEAIAPLFLVYFGFGVFPKVLISALICFFPVAINTHHGLTATPEPFRRLMHVLGSSPWQNFIRCQLPFATKYIIAAARVCAVLGLIGAVVGEFVGASAGLGHVIRDANADMGTERIYAALILLGSMGGLFYGTVALVERIFLARYVRA